MISIEDYPKVDGSTATIPLATALMQYATGCSEQEAEAAIDFSTTDYSYYALDKGFADLLLVYEASDKVKEELDIPKAFDIRPIGKDALVFIVNADNPIKSLTTKQIQDIYSGKITNWKEVGGQDLPIAAFQRPELSGSQTMIQKLVMGDIPMAEAPSEFVSASMGDLISDIASYDNSANALGYSVFYYAKNMNALPGLKFIAVDGVMPSETSIAADAYPFVNAFFGVLPKKPDPNAELLLDWLLTGNGQDFIASCGYVPVRGKAGMVAQPTSAKKHLWDKNYYAVLPSGNRTRIVYDSKGRAVGSFSLRGLPAYDYFPSGLYTAQELAEQALFVNGKQQELDFGRVDLPTYRYENGFYRYDEESGDLYVYDKNFGLRYTVGFALKTTFKHGRGYITRDDNPAMIAIGENDWIKAPGAAKYNEPRSQLRSKSGDILPCPVMEKPNLEPEYLFGESHFACNPRVVGGLRVYSICNFDGDVLAKNVYLVHSAGYYSRYYIKDQVLFDGDLKEVRPVTTKKNSFGNLSLHERDSFISGIAYDIDGVSSSGEASNSKWGAFIQGYRGGELHVRRGEDIFRFAVESGGIELDDFNDTFAVFCDKTKDYSDWSYEVRFLGGGESHVVDHGFASILLSDHYFIVRDYENQAVYLMDENGTRRFEAPSLSPLPGDVVLMRQGAYVGIADLNGNWLVKAINPDLADDGRMRWFPIARDA